MKQTGLGVKSVPSGFGGGSVSVGPGGLGKGLRGALVVNVLCQYLRGRGNQAVTRGHTLIIHGWQSFTPLQPSVCLSVCPHGRKTENRGTHSFARGGPVDPAGVTV